MGLGKRPQSRGGERMLGVFLQGGLGWCWWQGWGPREVLAAAGWCRFCASPGLSCWKKGDFEGCELGEKVILEGCEHQGWVLNRSTAPRAAPKAPRGCAGRCWGGEVGAGSSVLLRTQL